MKQPEFFPEHHELRVELCAAALDDSVAYCDTPNTFEEQAAARFRLDCAARDYVCALDVAKPVTGDVLNPERPLQSLQATTCALPDRAEAAAQDAHTELVSAVLGALKQTLDDPGHVRDAELAEHRLMFAARTFARAVDALPDEDLPAAWRTGVGESSTAGTASRFAVAAGGSPSPLHTVLDGLNERAREASATGSQGQAFARGLWTATSLIRKALEAEVGETSGAGNASRFDEDAAHELDKDLRGIADLTPGSLRRKYNLPRSSK